MDIIEQKIITFLTRNAHLDCEIPDIAFHLKLDEQQVQTSLNLLFENGIVTMRQNQYGRAFWYFVPQRSSVPFETMSTPVVEEFSDLDGQSTGMSTTKKMVITAFILSILSLGGIAGVFVWAWINVHNKFDTLKTEMQFVVRQEELAAIVDAVEKRIVKVESELKKTMIKVDSLKNEIKEMQVVPVPKLQENSKRR